MNREHLLCSLFLSDASRAFSVVFYIYNRLFHKKQSNNTGVLTVVRDVREASRYSICVAMNYNIYTITKKTER